ncbi:anaphase-promoting complex subunit 5 [Elaeis guineensis]|uniref:anaphase-promoting complex subunit 5 n=1 Tax=Elaeis guineensis var. tenera TaxID=51953 RepID=UPI003C6D14A8
MSRLMGGGSMKEGGAGVFDLTPHKIAVCHLIQLFAPPAQQAVPFPFHSVAHHNHLGLFLFSLIRSCDDFVEPPLEELINQLKAVGGLASDWLSEHLMNSLSALSSPDDLFNFFDKLRGVLAAPEGANLEDDQILLDPNSQLGVYLRCCILAFNLLSFEGVCHLLTTIGSYCNASDAAYELPEDDDFNNGSELHEFLEDAELDLGTIEFQKYGHNFEAETHSGECSLLHLHAPRSLYSLVEDVQVSVDPKFKHDNAGARSREVVSSLNNNFRSDDNLGILRSRWQIEGYLNMQADFIEKDASTFSFNSFTTYLKQLQKLAPELHRVQHLQYLNALYHDDYIAALDNLHCYFDYRDGRTFQPSIFSPSDIQLGRYETALLCLGTMHCHFGHSKKAFEALNEAVRVSQQNNDDPCLGYTLAAICNLLSEIGIPSTTGIIGSPYSLGTSTGLGTPLSTRQQLLVLLKRSLKRAESLKLMSLLAFNRLALAKFDLKHVKRPLLSFGPKASTMLRTCPTSICKELRLSSHVLRDFGSDGLSLQTENGAFSTSWLKNIRVATNPWLKNLSKLRSSLSNDFDIFQFDAQPSPIPGSILQLAGASYLLRATSWEHYGSAPLVRTNALVYATCFADAASLTELSLAYAKLIQHLAVFKGYTEAFGALKLAEERFLSVSKSRIQLLKLQLLHERALHRGHLKVAQQVCYEFGVLASSVNGVDMELKTEASLRHARTLLAANQFSQAAAVAHSLFCTCYKFNLQVENASVLLLLAEIHKKSGNAVLGIPYALASLSFCQSFNLDLLEASATLTLAELWLSLGSSHAKRASTLVHRALPIILGHGGLELRARANIAVAKCHLSDTSFSISQDPSVVLDPLTQAAEELEILEYHELAAEAFYLMAIVYDNIGKLVEREAAAASFRKHVIALEKPQDEEDPLAHGI